MTNVVHCVRLPTSFVVKNQVMCLVQGWQCDVQHHNFHLPGLSAEDSQPTRKVTSSFEGRHLGDILSPMSPRTDEEHTACTQPNKKAKIEPGALPTPFDVCQILLVSKGMLALNNPHTLFAGGKTRNDIYKLRSILDQHGFRTSIIASPREGLSIYKDSCDLNPRDLKEEFRFGRLFLVTLFGLHAQQRDLERLYTSYFKNLYCLALFCKRIRQACPDAGKDKDVEQLLAKNESLYKQEYSKGSEDLDMQEKLSSMASQVSQRVQDLIRVVNKAEPRNRVEQLEHEYQRIVVENSTLSNALVTRFLQEHGCSIKDIFFKRSHQPKYERITIYLYDPACDHYKPPHFLFLPSLHQALKEGPEDVAKEMIASFWSHMLRNGYFATHSLKMLLECDLQRFFLSGITSDVRIPLQLNAHFSPSTALSLYLHGKAGSGKSSFVRNFQPSIEATIEEFLDPEILVRFVKQNLNKVRDFHCQQVEDFYSNVSRPQRYETLELELELRPNNNDLSVMSIIQGRRMTMGQTKPGLVVVNLEEMPCNEVKSDPNQLKVAQLISQRFAGRKGDFSEQDKAPRNSDKRGIQKDSSLITLFTSNYELDVQCKNALGRLPLFHHLSAHEIIAVSGEDRVLFAKSYVIQCIKDRFVALDMDCVVDLDISFGDGDARSLVRYLRMIAFYICELVTGTMRRDGKIKAEVSQTDMHCLIRVGRESLDLKIGTLQNLFPLADKVFNPKVQTIVDSLTIHLGETCNLSELSIILDFWLSKTLTPTVIVSNDGDKIQKLVEVIGLQENIHSIRNVDAGEYKMMKSLYDPNDTPNLRDDILKLGRGANVVVELTCPSRDSQLCIREMIEDSPSMTAFSTSKSALYKSGLLFCVFVSGDITPEVRSRASIII
eukprot:scaffold4157_cov136-Cylindrotheca_fusiformis.AAC.24